MKTEISNTEAAQTNLDRKAPRRYCLTPQGLKSLQKWAHRRSPWQHSTGPRTAAGKARSKLNALKHGGRSAAVVAERRELNELIRQVREVDRLWKPQHEAEEQMLDVFR